MAVVVVVVVVVAVVAAAASAAAVASSSASSSAVGKGAAAAEAAAGAGAASSRRAGEETEESILTRRGKKGREKGGVKKERKKEKNRKSNRFSSFFFTFHFFAKIFLLFLHKRHPLVRQQLPRGRVPHGVRVSLAELDGARAVRVDLDRPCFLFLVLLFFFLENCREKSEFFFFPSVPRAKRERRESCKKKKKKKKKNRTLVRQGPDDDVHVQVGPADHVSSSRRRRLPHERVELRRQPARRGLLEVAAGDQEIVAGVRCLGRGEEGRFCPIRSSFEGPRGVQQGRGARLHLVQPRAVVRGQKVLAPRGGGLGGDGRRLGRVAVRALEVGSGGLVAAQGVADAGDEVVLVGENFRGEALVGEGLWLGGWVVVGGLEVRVGISSEERGREVFCAIEKKNNDVEACSPLSISLSLSYPLEPGHVR